MSVRETWSVVVPEAALVELRIPHSRWGTISGYFDDVERLIPVVPEWDGKVDGIYMTLNPVRPDLKARANNRVERYARYTTADSDIERRVWLLVDADPRRPAGISSTDEEHRAALELIDKVASFLCELGFPAGSVVRADSGNGAHVLVRVDLPNDERSTALLRQCLASLDFLFSDAVVEIDKTTYNAARITKLYGTIAAKGDATEERPHRRSSLISAPAQIAVADCELLERLASMAPKSPSGQLTRSDSAKREFDLEEWIRNQTLPVVAEGPWQGGKRWILNPCPWEPSHSNRAAYIVQLANGAIAAGCHHNSCTCKGWRELRSLFEPDAQYPASSRGDDGHSDEFVDQVLRSSGVSGVGENATPREIEAALRRFSELLAGTDPLRRGVARSAAVDLLERAKVRGAAKLVDAALSLIGAEAEEAQGSSVTFSEPEPWPAAVDGAELLDDIVNTLARYLVLPSHAAESIALWVVHTHAVETTFISPILVISSPQKRCGKTKLLELLRCLVHRPLLASHVSPAALFRAIEAIKPTLLIDEADTFLAQSDELRGILNSGHTRTSAQVIRTVGDDHEPRVFNTFGAKAIAGIGNLPGTIEDRALIVRMQRRARSERVDHLRADRIEKDLEPLRRRIRRWVLDHSSSLCAADPDAPTLLHDRASDNWRHLLAIADAAGENWRSRAAAAAVHLSASGESEDSDVHIQLLADVRELFERSETDRLPSSRIIEHLVGLENRPWPEWSRGKPLTPRALGKLLGRFRIRSEQVWVGKNLHGYYRKDFEDAFKRYLPDVGSPESLEGLEPLSPKAQECNSETLDSGDPSSAKMLAKPSGSKALADLADSGMESTNMELIEV